MTDIIKKDELPTLGILFTTLNRTEYSISTIHGTLRHLKYDGPIAWYIADAGSEPEHLSKIDGALQYEPIMGKHSADLSPGVNWNTGIREIFSQTEYYMRLEDDFVLRHDLDITLWMKLLMTNPTVGLVRLGLMPINLELSTAMHKTYTSIGYDEHIYFRVHKDVQYCFSGHPGLYHKRFHDAYGYFHETANPGDCELHMDSAVRYKKDGPEVWMPWDLGKYSTWGAYAHVGTEKSYDG